MSCRVFLLSPAWCGGERARVLLAKGARFDLAVRLRSPMGVPLGEAFSFLSGLYFRAKLAYAGAFARPTPGVPGTLVITPDEGLVSPEARIDASTLIRYASVRVDLASARYRRPFVRDARGLRQILEAEGGRAWHVVLLGSVATGKYVDVLTRIFGGRALFPEDFAGRGDMSRGGLLLRCVRAGIELPYVPLNGAARRGPRPPRLERQKR